MINFFKKMIYGEPEIRSTCDQLTLSEKSAWLNLMAIYKKSNDERGIPESLRTDRREEKKLRGLSEASAFHLDRDGHRCDDISNSVLQVVELPYLLEGLSPHSNYLFIRNFYSRLAQKMLISPHCKSWILTGNPGISKSFFHWYIFLFFFYNYLFIVIFIFKTDEFLIFLQSGISYIFFLILNLPTS